jgi:hypothetical protein
MLGDDSEVAMLATAGAVTVIDTDADCPSEVAVSVAEP